MNAETAQNPFPTSAEQSQGSMAANGLNGGNRVHKVAQTLHEAVDTLEQKIGEGSEKVMGSYEEYGSLAREQVRANPLAALGIAFAAGFIIAKVLR
jgi:ElaB/YqjD/DUF883 family membrane-anchored ribosome-binding protein